MDEKMPPTPRVSVVALLIHGFATRLVAEQARLKGQLEALVSIALPPLAAAERVVLDAHGGLSVAVLTRPRDAIDLAARCQAAAADLPVCIGVAHGPVRPATQVLGAQGLLGDGVVSAQTLAREAQPRHLFASRAFSDALRQSDPDGATLVPAGSFTDADLRLHELFTVDPGAALARRRRMLVVGGGAVVGILGLGLAVRFILPALASKPAVLEFDIAPRGDIFVDGVLKGKAPSLRRLELSAGLHTVEVRNVPHPPLKLTLNLGSDERMTIRHSFVVARKKEKDEGFLQGLRRRINSKND
jgi:hypothetical protein